jgi:hypothetical protein
MFKKAVKKARGKPFARGEDPRRVHGRRDVSSCTRTLPCDQIRFEPIAPILHAHRRLWKPDRWILQPTPQTHVGDGISRASLRPGEESAGWIIGGVRVFSIAVALMRGRG